MNRKILKLYTVSLVLALSISVGSATVEWEILNTLKLDVPPLDVAIFPNGKYVFILTHDSSVRIYDLDGRLRNKFKVVKQALDFAIADNGRSVFVLTHNGSIHMYGLDGRLRNKIEVGKQIDHITLGPKGERLFATNRQNQTVEVIALDYIQYISTQGSPFKGPENAPVVISEFSDFE
jgi:DNA-binding beta-propeller fold protein YncE